LTGCLVQDTNAPHGRGVQNIKSQFAQKGIVKGNKQLVVHLNKLGGKITSRPLLPESNKPSPHTGNGLFDNFPDRACRPPVIDAAHHELYIIVHAHHFHDMVGVDGAPDLHRNTRHADIIGGFGKAADNACVGVPDTQLGLRGILRAADADLQMYNLAGFRIALQLDHLNRLFLADVREFTDVVDPQVGGGGAPDVGLVSIHFNQHGRPPYLQNPCGGNGAHIDTEAVALPGAQDGLAAHEHRQTQAAP